MRTISTLILSGCYLFACAGPQAGADTDPVVAAPAADASSFEVHGFKVDRPNNWEFVAPDSSVAGDTVVLLHGPIGNAELRPVVEVSRRELSAADRKRKTAHILTTLSLEIVQTFSSFDAQGQPEDVEVGGLPGAMIGMKLTEMLPDGAETERVARFYAVVQGTQMWLIRCIGPADGAADADFDAIVSSVSISS